MFCCITILCFLLVKKTVCLQYPDVPEIPPEPWDDSSVLESDKDAMNATDRNNTTSQGSIKNPEHTPNITTRIVGGRECTVEEYPWMVSLRTTGRLTHFCGGALISARWVLSAAHCFEKSYDYPSSVTAIVGLSTLRRTRSQAITVRKIFIHGDYDSRAIINDIALIVLKHKVSLYLGTIGFVRMPGRSYSSDLSMYCPAESFTVAGWGSQKAYVNEPPPYKSSPHLMCVQVPFITNQECVRYSSAAHNDKVICTLYSPGGRDACQGDSGGPLFCNGVQYGIVSWGHGCAAPNAPGFYTRVDKYLDFISGTVKSYVDSASVHQKLNFGLFSIVGITILVHQV